MAKFNQNEQKRWTCDSTGSVTENARSNSAFTGGPANSTKHYPAKHHQNVRREFITPYMVVEVLRQEQASYLAGAAA